MSCVYSSERRETSDSERASKERLNNLNFHSKFQLQAVLSDDIAIVIVMFAIRRLTSTLASSSMPPMLHNLLPVSQASTAVSHTHPQVPAPVLWSKVESSLPLVHITPKTQGSGSE